MTPNFRFLRGLLAMSVLALGACGSYVKRADFDVALADLDRRVSANEAAIAALRTDLEARLDQHDVRLTELAGRLHVDMNVHFAFDSADLQEVDRATLDEFAQVLREHHDQAQVTVEGFADPAGSTNYNLRLGQRRADAVRDYLVGNGGLGAERVRSVSYGESDDRQLAPGAWGEQGDLNRRVSLVVDLPPRAG